MMKIINLLRTLRFIGWENPFRAIVYSLIRDQQDGALTRGERLAPSAWHDPGELLTASQTSHGAEFNFQRAQLEILFLTDEVIRVSWHPGKPPVPYAIQDKYWPGAAAHLSEHENEWVIHAGDVSAIITPTGSLEWHHAGIVIRHEEPPLKNGKAWRQHCPLPEACGVYGLGGRTRGLNLRGGTYRLWNSDPGGSYGFEDDPLYLTVPTMLVLQAESCYAVFYENSFDGEVSIDEHLNVQFDEGMLRYYLCFGSLQTALERYSDLTGKPPLPPQWSLGFHQSRWGYRSEQDIKSVLQGFNKHDLPISAVHLDIDYMDGYRVFTTNAHRFPNLKELSAQAEKQGVKLVSIIDPGVKIDRAYRLYQDGIQSDVFCTLPNDKVVRAPVWPGWAHYPDFTNPGTRSWWRGQYTRLIKHGISGIWHDMNEPTAFTAWGDPTLPKSTRHALEGQGGHHSQAHNLYGLLMNRAGREALRELNPDRRPFLLSRSGWAGNQRYAWNWTGDVESTWDGLRATLALMLGMGLSGITFTGSDIGGFSGDPSPELMVRWMQLAAFTPFFRTHSAVTTKAREPWRFEEPYYSAIRDMLLLRYRLLPYIYTLAWKTSNTGLPIIRPLFWAESSNPAYWNNADSFFLGNDLLVAPVLEEGASSKEIMLPPGKWYSFWDGTVHEGPAEISVDVQLDQIPLFTRGGCVLPMKYDNLELHTYVGDPGDEVSLLYSDEGDGYGPNRVDKFQLTKTEDSVELEWDSEGEYPFPYTAINIILHGAAPTSIMVDGKTGDPGSGPIRTTRFDRLEFHL